MPNTIDPVHRTFEFIDELLTTHHEEEITFNLRPPNIYSESVKLTIKDTDEEKPFTQLKQLQRLYLKEKKLYLNEDFKKKSITYDILRSVYCLTPTWEKINNTVHPQVDPAEIWLYKVNFLLIFSTLNENSSKLSNMFNKCYQKQ